MLLLNGHFDDIMKNLLNLKVKRKNKKISLTVSRNDFCGTI